MVYSYLRVSTIDQDVEKFRHAVLEYANGKDMGAVEFVEEKVSGKKAWQKRELGQLLDKCNPGDKVVVPELSRLARSIMQTYEIIEHCQAREIGLHIIKQNIVINGTLDMQTKVMISVFAMVGELERDFISLRTKEALAEKKRQGVKLGRPPGIGKSRLDPHRSEIQELLDMFVPKTKIAEKFGVTVANLHHYLKRRGIS